MMKRPGSLAVSGLSRPTRAALSLLAALSAIAPAAATLIALLAADKSFAADGVWAGAATPLAWDDSANWTGGVIADGADFTADFSATDLVGYTVVNLNSPRTIGNLTFGDSDAATPGSWNINNSNSANYLILSGTTPTINVPDLGAGQSASISTDIGGTGGLIKTGAGALISFGNKSYSGDTLVQAGTFTTTNTIPGGTSESRRALTISAGATVEFRSVFGDIGIRPSNITGAGTLLKTGSGFALLDGGDSLLSLSAGGLIDIRGGTLKLGNFNSQGNSMAGNLAAVVMASGTTFNLDSTRGVLGSLSGNGTVRAGYFGPRSLTIGTDNTSTTFAGEIRGNTYTANSSPTLIKTGNGALTLTGAVNIRADFGDNVLTVQGGTIDSPSTLNLHMTSASQIGVIGSGNGVTFGNAEGSFVVVSQTSGTITTPSMSVGRQGTVTYSLAGSSVANVSDLVIAETGPTTGNGAVVLNVADSAELRIIAGGSVVLGRFYGRPVTINQTGGLFGFFEDAAATTLGGTGALRFESGSDTTAYNLFGGTLAIPRITLRAAGGGAGGGSGIINLGGGTLKITNAAFTIPTVDGKTIALNILGDGAIPNSGANIDTNGLAITLNAPLAHGGTAAVDGGLTKLGAGSLTIMAPSTYTGPTVVSAGSLSVSAIGFGDSATVTVASGANLALDFSGDDQVAGLTLGGNALPAGTYSAATHGGFISGTGTLTVVPTVIPGFASWASGLALTGTPDADFDSDGLIDAVEYVLGTDPKVADLADITTQRVGTDLIVTFDRVDSSETPDAAVTVESGTDLTTWPLVYIVGANTGSSSAGVTITENDDAPDTVSVAIPLGTDTRRFARVRVTITP